jgi:UDP-glucose:(glucosyl)LPS alpha-1,2-glucosyltransferase
MQIIEGAFDAGEMAKNSNGGTETMARRVLSIGKKDLKEFQIVVSRIEEELNPDKIRILYCHDLPGDPASDHLKDNGHEKFHKIVCVSNWQMQRYIDYYHLPWSKCIVMQNAIDPIPFNDEKWSKPEKIRLIYHTTPHRGLEILIPVFMKLCEKYDNLELDVYSSFNLYGWPKRDEQYEPLFKQCREFPKINYHGTQTNEEVRKVLQQTHIFAYPSIWPETSCLSLMEAMSAGLVCVHSNYGALPETSANWSHMYSFHEDRNEHAKIFYTVLSTAIEDIIAKPEAIGIRLKTQKSYADIFYSWNPNRKKQWQALFAMLLDQVKDRSVQKEMFTYSTAVH